MKDIIAENPILLGLMLAAMAAAFLWGWLQTGKKPLAIAGLIMLVLVPVTWYLSMLWETDREKIQRAIRETAEAVQANDHAEAVRYIGDPETKRRAESELPNYEFDRVKISQMEIKMLPGLPPQAEVDVNAVAVVSSTRGHFQGQRALRRLFLTFEKDDDGNWLMVDYNHTQLNGQPDMFSPLQTTR